MSADVTALWTDLENSAAPAGVTRRRFYAGAPVDIFVGIENPARTRLLIIEASEAALTASGSAWPQSAGVTVAVERGTQGHGRASATARLTAPAYADVFTVLVTDLLATLKSVRDEAGAVLAFRGRLERWQRLLARHGADGLHAEEQRGLYGELSFLRNFLLPVTTPAAALDAWTGPLAKVQDFQTARCSVEVKVTTGNPEYQIHVSNVRQLDEDASPSGALYLFHAFIEERHQQGESLRAIVENLRRALGPLSVRFDDLLEQAGYLDIHASRYVNTGYVVKGHRFYAVKDGFPRIREAELRGGVGEVRYTIQAGACAPFAVPDSSVVNLFKEST